MQKKGTKSRAGAGPGRVPPTGTSGTGSRSQATRERILDAAERLFAQRGFYGVSVREITGAASVDVALASYHFEGVMNIRMSGAGMDQTLDVPLVAAADRAGRVRLDIRHPQMGGLLVDNDDIPRLREEHHGAERGDRRIGVNKGLSVQ